MSVSTSREKRTQSLSGAPASACWVDRFRSVGRTIIEPGISAAIAVLIALLISGNFTVVNLIAGGLIPFVAGVVGGWLRERRQGTA